MLTKILTFLFSGIGTTVFVGIIVAIYRWDRGRRERESERRIRRNTEEQRIIFEYKRKKYAESHSKTDLLKRATEQDYREARKSFIRESIRSVGDMVSSKKETIEKLLRLLTDINIFFVGDLLDDLDDFLRSLW